VGFSLSDDFVEKESKLRRRDTPHHLKNKRISGTGSGTGKDETEEERIRRILALVASGNSQPSSPRPSATSEPSLKVPYTNYLGKGTWIVFISSLLQFDSLP
jgi:hypothetical protein